MSPPVQTMSTSLRSKLVKWQTVLIRITRKVGVKYWNKKIKILIINNF